MGMETAEWYNNFCLVGHTDKRGKAWHYMEAMQGDEPNHYPQGIPYADVVRRLFDWKPIIVRTGNFVPCKKADANHFLPKLDKDGMPVLDDDGKEILVPVRIVEVPDMRGCVRNDNYLELGHHGKKWQVHDYEEWLLKLQSNVIGDTLDIWSAILLRNGAQACIQAALPETAHDDTTGMDFVPYIHGYTSLDSSLASTFGTGSLLIVCDNTMHAAARNAKTSYKAKHTAGSLSASKIDEVKTALSLIHQQADNSMAFFHELAAIKVTPKKWVEVLDIILPPAKEVTDDSTAGAKRVATIREGKREHMNSVYHDDPMANTWKGTALGVVQAVNTFATHYSTVKGVSRTQRNADKIIRGEFAKTDELTLKALAKALDMPELLPA